MAAWHFGRHMTTSGPARMTVFFDDFAAERHASRTVAIGRFSCVVGVHFPDLNGRVLRDLHTWRGNVSASATSPQPSTRGADQAADFLQRAKADQASGTDWSAARKLAAAVTGSRPMRVGFAPCAPTPSKVRRQLSEEASCGRDHCHLVGGEPRVLKAGDREALNVIPPRWEIGGTARAFTPGVRDTLEREIGRLANGLRTPLACDCALHLHPPDPPVVNAPDATAIALTAEKGVPVGAHQLRAVTAGERFAILRRLHAPGAYVWLGNGPARDTALHHNPRYDFNDDAIATGVAYWVAVAQEALEHPASHGGRPDARPSEHRPEALSDQGG
jgi:hypothetical protein